MITQAQAHDIIVKQFRKEFGGMNMSKETAIEFLNLVMHAALGGHIHTTQEKLVKAYNSVKADYFGIVA